VPPVHLLSTASFHSTWGFRKSACYLLQAALSHITLLAKSCTLPMFLRAISARADRLLRSSTQICYHHRDAECPGQKHYLSPRPLYTACARLYESRGVATARSGMNVHVQDCRDRIRDVQNAEEQGHRVSHGTVEGVRLIERTSGSNTSALTAQVAEERAAVQLTH
jgi:hypothetical protein